MNQKYQYHSEDERTALLIKYADKYLIEEQNISEGNFLVFSDTLPEPPKVYVSVPEEDYDDLKRRTKASESAINFLLLGGVGL